MIKGIDISNHNLEYLSSINFAPLHDPGMFTIMKASEGLTYKDRFLDLYYNIIHGSHDGAPDPERLYGFYHFARPENGNTPLQEAYNFLRHVRHHAGYAVYALDVEAGALSLSQARLDKWVYEWCKFVYDETGVRPMIYCSESTTKRFSKAAAYDCGLWCAKWSYKKPTNIKPWDFFAIWQSGTTGGKLDVNVFNGDIAAWRKYCGRK